jgi:KUP system potassium uptake protein
MSDPSRSSSAVNSSVSSGNPSGRPAAVPPPTPQDNAAHAVKAHSHGHGSLMTRMREAAGTVYGDIGTSVLYTVMEITRETIHLKYHNLPAEEVDALVAQGGADLVSRGEALGSLSLVFWALIFLTVKYDLLIMKACGACSRATPARLPE